MRATYKNNSEISRLHCEMPHSILIAIPELLSERNEFPQHNTSLAKLKHCMLCRMAAVISFISPVLLILRCENTHIQMFTCKRLEGQMNIILKYIIMMQQLANNISSIQNTMHQFPVVLLLYIASMRVLHPSATRSSLMFYANFTLVYPTIQKFKFMILLSNKITSNEATNMCNMNHKTATKLNNQK